MIPKSKGRPPVYCLLALAVSVLSVAAEDLLRISTFNAEWLGYPASSRTWSGSRDNQIKAAAQEILATDADIVALQEVVIDPLNGDALADLLLKLDELDPSSLWEGAYNSRYSYYWNPNFSSYPAQRQAFVWRGAAVRFIAASTLLTWIPSGDERFGSGRLPFMLRVEVDAGPVRRQLNLINLHLKCCRGFADRRLRSMETLVAELNSLYPEEPLIVLGDFNVADSGGAYGEIATWGIYQDNNSDGFADFFHAAGTVPDASWSDIDHILISDEVLPHWQSAPLAVRNLTIQSSVSDHDHVLTALSLEPSFTERYEAWVEVSFNEDSPLSGMRGPNDDPDRDGVSNLFEFIQGGAPLHKDGRSQGLKLRPEAAGRLILEYRYKSFLVREAVTIAGNFNPMNGASWTTLDPQSATFYEPDPEDPSYTIVRYEVPDPQKLNSQFFRVELAK